MAYCHRHGDTRSCGATTVVVGQDFVKVDGNLWAVDQDPNNHSAGNLHTTHSWLKINGKGVIVVGDSASPDNLCYVVGGPHCNPYAVGYDNLINVQ